MPTQADIYRAVNANGEFLRTLKTYLENIIREEGVSAITLENPLPTEERRNHTEYTAAQNVAVSDAEAEINLGGTYDEITILNTGATAILIRLNANTNDQIELTPTGTADSSMSIEFEITKIYHETASGTSSLRYMATR